MCRVEALWLDQLEEGHRSHVGAKVFRLAELARIGVSVPRGFAVPALGLSVFLATSGVGDAIQDILHNLDHRDDAAVEAAAARIDLRMAAAAVSAELADPIRRAYLELCRQTEDDTAVAVRSSGAREDGTMASFAGQYVTVLGARGIERVLAAVKECWASAFCGRVLGYALRNGISPLDAPLAVGIMTLVSARSAGVAFSAHPTTGSRSRMVIEASWGWGEAVVQGLVTPDYVEVDKFDGRVLTYRVNEKRIVSTFDAAAGRVTEGPMPAELIGSRVLDDDEIRCLHRAVLAIERYYGMPVDVEWAIDDRLSGDQRVTIVQARPVTTLREPTLTTWDLFASAMRFGLTHDTNGG